MNFFLIFQNTEVLGWFLRKIMNIHLYIKLCIENYDLFFSGHDVVFWGDLSVIVVALQSVIHCVDWRNWCNVVCCVSVYVCVCAFVRDQAFIWQSLFWSGSATRHLSVFQQQFKPGMLHFFAVSYKLVILVVIVCLLRNAL